ncbi:hypothetical protein [Curtobacterium caseinilyticum]|uniref:Lipoprotein n=1 Tax=Curtobacterium caseinilyticum TaxID=3055137 RepID=A0ABT7TTP0_9MICO|nr:hypothetical protein [Curtobacterium caseinilyticum]MDM7892955.1 hypothetical protein [Curtobacterium caseinilyticum]
MSPTKLRLAATLAATLLGALLLSGCTGGDGDDAASEDYAAWMSQSSAQLKSISTGNEGGAGGRLTVEDGGEKAQAKVFLEYDFAGPYDVVAACRSSKPVHLVTSGFTTSGGASDVQSVLARADIACGGTSRIHIDVPEDQSGIALDASTLDRSGQALFNTHIVARQEG